MAIARAGIRVAFDGSSERNGHGACVGFTAVRGVIDGDEWLSGVDYRVGNADVGAVVFAGTEIGMNGGRGPDEIDDRGGIGVDGEIRNVGVPEIVGRKWNEATEAGALTGGHLRAG